MKKLIFTLILAFVSLASFSQPKFNSPFKGVNLSEYVNTDSLKLEWTYAYVNKDIPQSDDVIPCGGGYYMFKLKQPRYFVIKTNEDKTKAVLEGFHPMFLFREYNLFEDERSIVLWYKDDNLYCGYVYSKKEKAFDKFADREKKFTKKFERFFNRKGRGI